MYTNTQIYIHTHTHRCPQGKTTREAGLNIGLSSCVCPSGRQLGDDGEGGDVCLPCPMGTYHDMAEGAKCVPCPVDMTTMQVIDGCIYLFLFWGRDLG